MTAPACRPMQYMKIFITSSNKDKYNGQLKYFSNLLSSFLFFISCFFFFIFNHTFHTCVDYIIFLTHRKDVPPFPMNYRFILLVWQSYNLTQVFFYRPNTIALSGSTIITLPFFSSIAFVPAFVPFIYTFQQPSGIFTCCEVRFAL